MAKSYSKYLPVFIGGLLLLTSITSCRKDKALGPTALKPLATIGLYEQLVDTIYRRVYVAISKVGTTSTNYYGIFDTGSTGLTIDATGLIPASMITSSGIQVTGDSVNVNGITITSHSSIIKYGDVGSETDEYGNLAYTTVTIGDQNGSIATTRIPIFLYYKIVNKSTGATYPAHSNDVFGVGPGTSQVNSSIGSPLSYFKTGTSVTNGFKLAMFSSSKFTGAGNYVSGLLTIGLVPNDLSSAGFIMHPLTYYSTGGYSPDISGTISYNGKSIPATLLFDTGTPSVTILEDNTASSQGNLPANSVVTVTTNNGFSYSYTTNSTYNLTTIGKPSVTGDPRTIYSIDFFLSNEYLMDYTDHQLGLKNN
ncbi:MAG: hypothetical protein JWQ84_1871 [Mucilaginibacter sp.]|nr:hypothetical protein [Mucilaginibacter sp.]